MAMQEERRYTSELTLARGKLVGIVNILPWKLNQCFVLNFWQTYHVAILLINTSHHEGKQIKAACRQKERAASEEKKWQQEQFRMGRSPKRRQSRLNAVFFAPPFVLDALHQQLQKATTKEFSTLKSSGMDGMSPAHASTRRETKSENKSSFPHKAQDKINPIHILKAKMSVFLALLLMLLENMVTQAHYPWQKIPLLYKINC